MKFSNAITGFGGLNVVSVLSRSDSNPEFWPVAILGNVFSSEPLNQEPFL
jgi:hypothetical protein